MTTGVLANIAWVPYSRDAIERARSDFEKRLYQDKACGRCEYLPERHCDVCDNCPAFLGHYRLWRKRTVKGKKQIGFPTGDRRLLKSALALVDVKLKDKRVRAPMRNAISFTGKYNPGQKEAVMKMAKKGYGLLEAPPRSGKTVMACAVSTVLGYKTLIMANQTEFLNQFLETYIGNPRNKIKPFTDALDYGGSEIVGLAKKYEDFERFDVALATYQTFLSPKGQELLKAIAPMFGTVIVDEAHKVAAKCFLKVVNRFPAACRIGLTGTPDRKDGRDVLTAFVLGPVVHAMHVETLVPRVVMMETNTKLARNYKQWTAFESALADDPERNRFIIKTAVADIKAGRSIVIPVTRVHHAIALAKAINRVMGESVAAHFIGTQSKDERKSIIEKARRGDIRCVVGMRQLVQLGINVPLWDTLYVVMHISNPPNFKQETARIRTPAPDKPQPLIRHFIEDIGAARGCLRTCYWQTYKAQGFTVTERDQRILQAYLAQGAVEVKSRKPIKF